VGQSELIKRIAAKNKNTIVVVISGGGVDMQPWLDQVPAVLQAWYPGQEGGTAVAEIVAGDVNPSGHLAATFEKRWEDNPSYNYYYPEQGSKTRVVYREGVFTGYCGYEHKVKPQFPFGYGLSYTTFRYANLKADEHGVTFDVTNTGTRRRGSSADLHCAGTCERTQASERAEGILAGHAAAGRNADRESSAAHAVIRLLRCARQALARGEGDVWGRVGKFVGAD